MSLELRFDRVRKFHARGGNQLHAIVVIRIVRGGNHHARRESFVMHQPGHSGRGEHSGGNGFRARRSQARARCVRRCAGRIRAYPGRSGRAAASPAARMRADVFAERQADAVERGVVQRGYSPGTPRMPSVPKSCLAMELVSRAKKSRHVILSLPSWRSRAAGESTSERINFAKRRGEASVRGGTGVICGARAVLS